MSGDRILATFQHEVRNRPAMPGYEDSDHVLFPRDFLYRVLEQAVCVREGHELTPPDSGGVASCVRCLASVDGLADHGEAR